MHCLAMLGILALGAWFAMLALPALPQAQVRTGVLDFRGRAGYSDVRPLASYSATHGQHTQIAFKDTPEGHSQNRRVEVVNIGRAH